MARPAMRKTPTETLWACCFLAPNFIGFVVFTLLPVAASLAIAFTDWDILTEPKWAGMSNFIALLGFHRETDGTLVPNDPFFWKYLWNTLFLMGAIPITMVGSLVLAVLLNQKIRGVWAFRTAFFLPTICAGVALVFLWKWMYATDTGLINQTIERVGGWFGWDWNGAPWLTSTRWAKPALVIMSVWQGVGGVSMLLYLAALQDVPRQLYEAAEIDGAGPWRRFWAITWPMVSPTTFFIFITSIIAGFQGGFMAAYVMTDGGPAGATTTLEYYIYNNAYEWFRMGYASAVAWLLFLIILAVTLVNWRYGGKRVHY